jgi:hypothetical protein
VVIARAPAIVNLCGPPERDRRKPETKPELLEALMLAKKFDWKATTAAQPK